MAAVALAAAMGCDGGEEDPEETSSANATGMQEMTCAEIQDCLEMSCSSEFMALAAAGTNTATPEYMMAKMAIVTCIGQCGVTDYDTKQEDCLGAAPCDAYKAALACTPGSGGDCAGASAACPG